MAGFVTVTNKLPPAVQLRSLPHGELTRRLLQSRPGTTVSAARAVGGKVLIAVSTGCRTTLERVALATDRTTKMRTIGETVADIAVSPDGSRLAYLTHPSCPTFHCTTVCAGPAHKRVLVQADIGYGSGRCGRSWATRIFRVVSGTLQSVLALSGNSAPIQLEG